MQETLRLSNIEPTHIGHIPPPSGLFCTHHRLGESVGSDPLLSKKKRMVVEKRVRRHSKDLDETHLKRLRKFKIEVMFQVKVMHWRRLYEAVYWVDVPLYMSY